MSFCFRDAGTGGGAATPFTFCWKGQGGQKFSYPSTNIFPTPSCLFFTVAHSLDIFLQGIRFQLGNCIKSILKFVISVTQLMETTLLTLVNYARYVCFTMRWIYRRGPHPFLLLDEALGTEGAIFHDVYELFIIHYSNLSSLRCAQ